MLVRKEDVPVAPSSETHCQICTQFVCLDPDFCAREEAIRDGLIFVLPTDKDWSHEKEDNPF